MKLTAEVLQQCTGAPKALAEAAVDSANKALELYNITTVNRVGMFLANVGHETAGLRYRVELWGPTEAQKGYEGRTDLGNIYLGDGRKYCGRGWLQTTGRSNYQRLTERLRKRWPGMVVPDFVAHPDELALPEWCAISAADYWEMQRISRFADIGDFDGVCDLINRGHKTMKDGDTNGYPDRLRLWSAAKPALILAGFPLSPPV